MIIAKLKYSPRIYVEELKKIKENLFRIAVVLGEIQTRTQYSALNHVPRRYLISAIDSFVKYDTKNPLLHQRALYVYNLGSNSLLVLM